MQGSPICRCCYAKYGENRDGYDLLTEHIVGEDWLKAWLGNISCPIRRKTLLAVPEKIAAPEENNNIQKEEEIEQEKQCLSMTNIHLLVLTGRAHSLGRPRNR